MKVNTRVTALERVSVPKDQPPLDTVLLRRVQGYVRAFERQVLPPGDYEDPDALRHIGWDIWSLHAQLQGRGHKVSDGFCLLRFTTAFDSIGKRVLAVQNGDAEAQRQLLESEERLFAGHGTDAYRTAHDAWCLLLEDMQGLADREEAARKEAGADEL